MPLWEIIIWALLIAAVITAGVFCVACFVGKVIKYGSESDGNN